MGEVTPDDYERAAKLADDREDFHRANAKTNVWGTAAKNQDLALAAEWSAFAAKLRAKAQHPDPTNEQMQEMARELHAAINEPMYAGTRKDWQDRALRAEAALEAKAQAAPQIIAWEDVKDGEYVWLRFRTTQEWYHGKRNGHYLEDGSENGINLFAAGDVAYFEFAKAKQQPGGGR